jgi:hypothetical protein
MLTSAVTGCAGLWQLLLILIKNTISGVKGGEICKTAKDLRNL